MKKYFEILKNSPLFFHIDAEGLLSILSCLGAHIVHYEKKDTILAEGVAARQIGIVLSGSVQIVQVDYFGNRSIVSGAGPSDLFGEAFACAAVEAIPVSVVAGEACDVMFVDYLRITQPCCKACTFHQQLIYNLMKDMASKNIGFHQRIEVTSKRSTREKLLAYLFLEAKRQNSRRFKIPYDRQELADYLEVDRSGLSAEISKLRREGLLKSEKNEFELLD